jgi:hypothetical protein
MPLVVENNGRDDDARIAPAKRAKSYRIVPMD